MMDELAGIMTADLSRTKEAYGSISSWCQDTKEDFGSQSSDFSEKASTYSMKVTKGSGLTAELSAKKTDLLLRYDENMQTYLDTVSIMTKQNAEYEQSQADAQKQIEVLDEVLKNLHAQAISEPPAGLLSVATAVLRAQGQEAGVSGGTHEVIGMMSSMRDRTEKAMLDEREKFAKRKIQFTELTVTQVKAEADLITQYEVKGDAAAVAAADLALAQEMTTLYETMREALPVGDMATVCSEADNLLSVQVDHDSEVQKVAGQLKLLLEQQPDLTTPPTAALVQVPKVSVANRYWPSIPAKAAPPLATPAPRRRHVEAVASAPVVPLLSKPAAVPRDSVGGQVSAAAWTVEEAADVLSSKALGRLAQVMRRGNRTTDIMMLTQLHHALDKEDHQLPTEAEEVKTCNEERMAAASARRQAYLDYFKAKDDLAQARAKQTALEKHIEVEEPMGTALRDHAGEMANFKTSTEAAKTIGEAEAANTKLSEVNDKVTTYLAHKNPAPPAEAQGLTALSGSLGSLLAWYPSKLQSLVDTFHADLDATEGAIQTAAKAREDSVVAKKTELEAAVKAVSDAEGELAAKEEALSTAKANVQKSQTKCDTVLLQTATQRGRVHIELSTVEFALDVLEKA